MQLARCNRRNAGGSTVRAESLAEKAVTETALITCHDVPLHFSVEQTSTHLDPGSLSSSSMREDDGNSLRNPQAWTH